MKKLITLMVYLLIPTLGYAVDGSFTKIGGGDVNTIVQVSEDGLWYSRDYYLSPGTFATKRIGSMIQYSSVTYADVTFSTNSYSAGSGNIAITAHGLTMAIPVIARLTSGTIPPPLTAETTYYAFPYSANIVGLSTTAAKAIASDPILFTSSKPADGTQTYTLVIASPSVEGMPTFTFKGSNDGSRFFALGVSSSPGSGYDIDPWGYDFSYYNYSMLKLTVTPPTAGGVKFKATLNLKQK